MRILGGMEMSEINKDVANQITPEATLYVSTIGAIAERGGLSAEQYARMKELEGEAGSTPEKAELLFLQRGQSFGHPGDPFPDWAPCDNSEDPLRFVWADHLTKCEWGTVVIRSVQAGYTIEAKGKDGRAAKKHVTNINDVEDTLMAAVSFLWCDEIDGGEG